MEYIISVGEPWDYMGPDGHNVIKGSVIKIVDSKCVVFKANHIHTFNKDSGNVFVLFPRYQNEVFDRLFINNEIFPVNGCLVLRDYNEYLTNKDYQDNSVFVLIGSLREEK